MVEKPDDHDPDAAVWRTVAELERKGFTRAEIAAALTYVGDEVSRNGVDPVSSDLSYEVTD
jgi:hypothetical protein